MEKQNETKKQSQITGTTQLTLWLLARRSEMQDVAFQDIKAMAEHALGHTVPDSRLRSVMGELGIEYGRRKFSSQAKNCKTKRSQSNFRAVAMAIAHVMDELEMTGEHRDRMQKLIDGKRLSMYHVDESEETNGQA
jgi:hypothetical protein